MKSPGFLEKLKNRFKGLTLSSERKQKIFAAAIFVVFFIGLAYVCVQQFPNINRGTEQYQNQSNFAVHISPANLNKSTARNSKNANIFNRSEQLSKQFNEFANSFTQQFSVIAPVIGLKNASSVYQSEKHSRIIVDQNNRLLNLPQWSGVEQKTEEVKALAEYASKYDSPLFFIQMPTAVTQNTMLPYGIYDNNSVQIDRVLKTLQIAYRPQINVVDLRKFQKSFGKYITYPNDALPLPDTSQKAADFVATATEKALNLKYSLDSNNMFSNKDNYRTQTMKKHFAGDFTLSLGEGVAPKSNFPIIFPKFDTKYWVNTYDDSEMSNSSTNTFTGSMKDAVMDKSLFTSSEQCNNGYLREGKYCITINNLFTHADNEFSVLVISDKQGKSFATFFSQYVKRLTFVDAESHSFPERINRLIKENKYDAVYVLVSDSTYELENFWRFDRQQVEDNDIAHQPQNTSGH